MSFWALALAIQTAGAAAAEPPPASPACDKPVLMVVTGTTLDRARMGAYARAIAESKLYEKLGGYYLNIPAPIANFEGQAEEGHTTLTVRFPCLENAKAFWYSKVYQEEIRPLRLDPSAGDYIVRVYPEAPLRPDMKDSVGDNAYVAEFSKSGIAQAEQ